MLNIRRVATGFQIIPSSDGNTAPSEDGELAVWDSTFGTASYTGTPAGATTPVTITANNPGYSGNFIHLTFTGTNSITSEIASWNTANPTNLAILSSGDGTQVPLVATVVQLTGAGDGNLYYNNGVSTYALSASITGFTGDITSTPGPGVVDVTVLSVGGASAASIAAAAAASGSATSADVPNTLVLRDSSGNFAAGTITASLIGNVTGNLTGNVTGNVSGTSSNITGLLSPFNGGTGVSNSNSATLTFTSAFPLTLTTTASTTLTLPITGTLATLSNPEVFSNKTFATAQTWQEIGTPVVLPPAGSIDIYAKGDNNIYTLSSGGLETSITAGSSPAGAIVMFGGIIVPTGWLLCDGSAVNIDTYSTLYG